MFIWIYLCDLYHIGNVYFKFYLWILVCIISKYEAKMYYYHFYKAEQVFLMQVNINLVK